jgi:hypothetical protein
MADGRSRTVESIVQGCKNGETIYVIDDTSVPRKVLNPTAHVGVAPMYRVTSNNSGRDSWTCNADHILVLKYNIQPYVTKKQDKPRSKPFVMRTAVLVAGADANSQVPKWIEESFASHADAEAAKEAVQPLVFECTVRDFLAIKNSTVRRGCQMWQPSVVTFARPLLSLQVQLGLAAGASVLDTDALALSTAWVIGMWIADGTTNHSQITQIGADAVNPLRGHQPVIDALLQWCRAVYPHETEAAIKARQRQVAVSSSGNPVYTVTMGPVLIALLRAYGIYDKKSVPLDLVRETVAIRKALLEGLIDGDGSFYAKDNEYTLPCKERKTIDIYVQLARSLGFTTGKVSVNTVTNEAGDQFQGHCIRIGGALASLAPVLAYKRCTGMNPQRDPACDGFKIEEVGEAEFYGFTVEGSGRLLMDDFVVSHNCAMISKQAGGIGLSVHNIRAAGSYIRGTNGTSNGQSTCTHTC